MRRRGRDRYTAASARLLARRQVASFAHVLGAVPSRFSRAAWEMVRSPAWLAVPVRDDPAPVSGEIERP